MFKVKVADPPVTTKVPKASPLAIPLGNTSLSNNCTRGVPKASRLTMLEGLTITPSLVTSVVPKDSRLAMPVGLTATTPVVITKVPNDSKLAMAVGVRIIPVVIAKVPKDSKLAMPVGLMSTAPVVIAKVPKDSKLAIPDGATPCESSAGSTAFGSICRCGLALPSLAIGYTSTMIHAIASTAAVAFTLSLNALTAEITGSLPSENSQA